MRPANIITAHADILVGVAASGAIGFSAEITPESSVGNFYWISLLGLLLSSTGLYGGGVVLNDVFDAELDAKERPERAIPSGRVKRYEGGLLGGLCLAAGVGIAFQISSLSGTIAAVIGVAVILYNAFSKHHVFWGPLNMGICRGANLLLGISILPEKVAEFWFLALLPIIYIAAITLISRGEVHGGSKKNGFLAVAMIGLVIAGTLLLGLMEQFAVLIALPFILLFSARVLPPFVRAAREPEAEKIKTAVMVGVLSLILFNAMLAAGFSGWIYGTIVLLLYPLSRQIAKYFAVT
ncbi:MAG: UbiA-like protein EboC [SAR324 cluster bacterium]|nr:UbiA-like protein EboC [SAR324 cluster bacterium]